MQNFKLAGNIIREARSIRRYNLQSIKALKKLATCLGELETSEDTIRKALNKLGKYS